MLASAFPSLNSSLSSSKVLGLYFSSAWCPDCTPCTPALKQIFESQSAEQPKFSVVYVSSDRSEQQMMDCYTNSHGKWGYVPFESDERNELKRKFGACAGAEVMALNMAGQRKYGIPTLVLIDCETEEVLSFDGIQDVMSGNLLQKWGLL